jgi:carboxyl-terminal processing protease
MIPVRSQNEAQSATLSADQRKKVLNRVLSALQKRFYAPEKLNGDWQAAVERHRPLIEAADTAAGFEKEVSDLLKELQTSHLGFFHRSARRASSRAALSVTYLEDETEYGKRWIFQNVHAGGAASAVGIEPGDILLSVDEQNMVPPEHPVFKMGEKTSVEVVGADNQKRRVIVDVARPKVKKLHFAEPKLVEARHLNDGVGYLKIAMFPGLVGVEVASETSQSLAALGEIDSLVIDLRGNAGGGIGALRVMSLLTPGRIPVGFALARGRGIANLDTVKHSFRRFHSIPESKSSLWLLAARFGPAMLSNSPIVLETEGLGTKRFHGRIVVLVDRHTASAAEMIVAFVRENRLAMIVGEPTAGRLLSATSVKVGAGYRLALPTGAYYTWKGLALEGTPIEPDQHVEFDWRERRAGVDAQLNRAIEFLRRESLPSPQLAL